MIEISHVNKWYGPNFQALKDCTTSVAKGEVVCIIGPSGSGKSTLVSQALVELVAHHLGHQLPAEEEELEIHLLECRECRERVARAEDLRESFRALAAEDTARTVVQAGLLAWLARRSRAARLGLLAAAVAVLAAFPAWLLLDRARLEAELTAARKAADRPEPPAPQPGPSLDQLARDNSRLEEELRNERSAREGLAAQLERLTRPQINAVVYSLGLVRGSSETTATPRPAAARAWASDEGASARSTARCVRNARTSAAPISRGCRMR